MTSDRKERAVRFLWILGSGCVLIACFSWGLLIGIFALGVWLCLSAVFMIGE